MKLAHQMTLKLSPLIESIHRHPLHTTIQSLADLHIFTEHDIFAAWDYLYVLKELRWRMIAAAASRLRSKDTHYLDFIHRLFDEEQTHFKNYLSAMKAIGAKTPEADIFQPITAAITGAPRIAQSFFATTREFLRAETPILMAAYVYGQEVIRPSLFVPLAQHLEKFFRDDKKEQINPLIQHLKCRAERDEVAHWIQVLKIFVHCAKKNKQTWQAIEAAARQALQARLDFFDSIQRHIENVRQTTIYSEIF